MTQSTFSRCSSCGGPTEFSPSLQALACPYCRATQAIAHLPPNPEKPLEQIPDAQAVRESGLRTASCGNCGASAEIAATTAATRCAFCTHPLVVDPSNVSRVPSDNVVAFRVDKTAAAAAFDRWLHGLWFRPNDLKTAARLDHLRGVYIPSWVFSAYAQSQWTAEAGYHYYVTETVVENGQKVQKQVQKTRWEHAAGQHQNHYRGIVVEASKGLEEAELRSLEPFDITNAMVGYRDEYLAGFEAECLSSTARSAWVPGAGRVEVMERNACGSQVPGDTHRNLQVRTYTSMVHAASTLVPVYIAAYVYKEVVYRLLVNGQTAKVVGKAPWSWVKITFAILAVLAIVAVIAIASSR